MSRDASSRSVGQLTVAAVFGILAAAFLFRSFFYGYKWLAHAVEGTANFKVMTIWTLGYSAVCSVIAWVAFHKPREDDRDLAGGSDEI